MAFFAIPVRTAAITLASKALRRATPTKLSGTLSSKVSSYGDNKDVGARLSNVTRVESLESEPEESSKPDASVEELSEVLGTLSEDDIDEVEDVQLRWRRER